MDAPQVEDDLVEVLFTEKQIHDRLEELAREITADYEGKELLIVGILRGAAMVMVDHQGRGYAADEVPLRLRRARSTRISIDGNAHFCRGLLRTRYPEPELTSVGKEQH